MHSARPINEPVSVLTNLEQLTNMTNHLFRLRFQREIRGFAFLLIAVATFAPQVKSAVVWDGPPITFTNLAGTDPTQPTNQDRLTADVWLTRGNSQGLFNAALESSFIAFFSPSKTEWSYGALSNHASLTYTDWEDMYGGSSGGGPPATIGQDTVVHLISDDIYLSIRLTSWGVRSGGFSYIRSTPNTTPPPPATPTLINPTMSGNGSFQLAFTNAPGYTFTVLGTTNLSLTITNWTVLGQVTDAPPGSGSYHFTDPGAGTNHVRRFYRVKWP